MENTLRVVHNKTNPWRVFEFRVNGEKEWVAAKNYLKAIIEYVNTSDIGLYDFKEGDDLIEVPEKDWDNYWIEDENGIQVKSFRQAVAELEGPGIFCTTANC